MGTKDRTTEAAAFLSYAHFDDKVEAGRISRLAQVLQGRISLGLGREFRIFIDRIDIEWGERWEERIDKALDEALFLVPIITPAYFRSRMCRHEYIQFLKRESQLGRADLIRPIYYVEADSLEKARWRSSQTWITDIARRQYSDWRQLRLRSLDDIEVVKAMETMATEIRSTVQGRGTISWKKDRTMTSTMKTVPRSEDQIVGSYKDLSRTQKLIVYTIYTLVHPPEIAVDDLLNRLRDKFPQEIDIASTAELFYRVKDLVSEGLLAVRKMGHNTTLVCGIPRVAKILHEGHHLPT